MINHLKRIILVCAYRYYVMDDPILADFAYDNLCKMLKSFGDLKTGFEDENFKDWSNTNTGYHFKYSARVIGSAHRVNARIARTVYGKIIDEYSLLSSK